MGFENSAIANRYAVALVALEEDGADLDSISNDLDAIRSAFASEEGVLFSVMINPGFLLNERRALLDAVIAKTKPQPLAANFLRLLLEKRRFANLAQIIDAFHTLLDARQGRVRAEVVTAFALDDKLTQEIHAALTRSTGQEIVLSSRVDADLIGGLVIQVGDTVYDASLRSRIESLKRQLLSNATPAEA
jgi:F-type H+-transporting ATPase subunit delta